MSEHIIYTVQGKGRFPIDMLRHDQCYPMDGESAEALLTPEKAEDYRTMRQVRLAGPRCTVGRWNSFGWGIVPEADGGVYYS